MIQNYSSSFELKIWSRKLFPVNTYRRFVLFSQIVHEMKRLARLNESLVKVFSLGKTYENRTMYGIKVSVKTDKINCMANVPGYM